MNEIPRDDAGEPDNNPKKVDDLLIAAQIAQPAGESRARSKRFCLSAYSVRDSSVALFAQLSVTALVNRSYDELRKIARSYLKQERPDHSWGPTELVHEAYFRLVRDPKLTNGPERSHFFFAATRAMRQLLVEHARKKRGPTRGGGRRREPLDDALAFYEAQQIDVVALNDALETLEKLNQRQARIVDLHIFAGCTFAEVAQQLGLSIQTIENDFRKARAFLHTTLAPEQ